MNIPGIIERTLLKYDVTYKWDKNISAYISVDAEQENDSLKDLLLSLNHKSTVGLGTAVVEWIYWMLCNKDRRDSVSNAIESMWVGIIDKRYIVPNSLYFSGHKEPDGIVDGPIWRSLFILTILKKGYLKGEYFISNKLVSLIILARHISPNKELFDDWLSHCIMKASKLFPSRYDSKEMRITSLREYQKGYYDSSDEPPIPRDFYFNNDFKYGDDNMEKLINDFMSELSFEKNPYLSRPDIMQNNVFVGIPYKYKVN